MKMVRFIKVGLNETFSRPRLGHILYEMFPIRNGLKQGHALWPLLFNFALEYVIRKDEINQNALKLNGTHQLMLMMFIYWEENAESFDFV